MVVDQWVSVRLKAEPAVRYAVGGEAEEDEEDDKKLILNITVNETPISRATCHASAYVGKQDIRRCG